MKKIEAFLEEIKKDIPVRICYKDQSVFMKWLNPFVSLFTKDFMTRFTTTIGYTVYFPSQEYVKRDENNALQILAHEAVHLLDTKKWSRPVFMTTYLFPQILALGIFFFPWLGITSLFFLLFLLPLPAPFRFFWESRGYTIDIITSKNNAFEAYIKYFTGWDYYMMFPFPKLVSRVFNHWVEKIESREDKILLKVWLIYEMANELE